jgi:hypothetical protein
MKEPKNVLIKDHTVEYDLFQKNTNRPKWI